MNNLFEKITAQQFIRNNILQNGLDQAKDGSLFTSQGNITIREGCLSIIFDIEDINIANRVLDVLEPYLKYKNPDAL